jgi:hypothetical protein
MSDHDCQDQHTETPDAPSGSMRLLSAPSPPHRSEQENLKLNRKRERRDGRDISTTERDEETSERGLRRRHANSDLTNGDRGDSAMRGYLYIYDKHDEYVDELEELDAYNLAIKLLDSVEGLRIKVHRNIRGNTWKEYIVRAYARWKKDRGLAFAR